MKKLFLSAAVAAAMLASSGAIASTILVASDNFQQDSLGLIKGQSGGTGFAGAWTSAQTTTGPNVVDPANDMQGDRALQFTSDSDSAASRTLTSSITNDVLIRFQFQYTGTVLGNNDFLGLWFGNADGPNIGLKGNCGGGTTSCTNDLFVRMTQNAQAMIGNSDLVAGTTYTLLGHLYKGTGSTTYNQFDAWLNPSSMDLATLGTPAHSQIAANSGLSSFNQIGFRTANLNDGGGVAALVDNIELFAVPEPTSVALLGISLLAMGGLRRRRQK